MRPSVTARALFVVACAGAIVAGTRAQPADYDLLITNGRVLDGTGNPFYIADVAVKAGRIAAIGKLRNAAARRTIDARNLYVTPGFIDMHSHGGPNLHKAELRTDHNSVMQGITTALLNPDGGSMWPVADHIAQYQKDGVGLNVFMTVGHNKIRELAMGMAQRVATPQELEKMRQLLRQGFDEGALGFTLGLEGAPGRWSDTHELVEMGRVVAQYDAFYHAHQRAEGRTPRWWNASRDGDTMDGLDATRETIEVGEQSGARVMATHFKFLGRGFWGASAAALRLIDEARQRGVQMYLDTYTYESYGNTPNVAIMPTWALVAPGVDVGGQDFGLAGRLQEPFAMAKETLRRRLQEPEIALTVRRDIEYEIEKAGGPEGVLVVDHPKKEYTGRFLREIAAMYGEDPVDTAIRLEMEGDPRQPGGGSYRGMNIVEEDNDRIVAREYTMYCTDGGAVPFGVDFPHPRYYGVFPRIIRKYALDRNVISLPFAIRAMTSLPASVVGLADRGTLRVGNWADVTVFDPMTIRPNSTYMKPHVYPTGIVYVAVNGDLVVDRGKLTGTLAGKVLTRAAR